MRVSLEQAACDRIQPNPHAASDNLTERAEVIVEMETLLRDDPNAQGSGRVDQHCEASLTSRRPDTQPGAFDFTHGGHRFCC